MKVKGIGKLQFFEDKDECPQMPGDDPAWQDSFVLNLWDIDNNVYAFLRVSQVPNKGEGIATAWLNIWVPGFMYKNTQVELPLMAGDRTASSLSVGEGLCRYSYDDAHLWTVNDPQAEVYAQLTLRDSHPGMCFYPNADDHFVTQTTSNHIEASGQVTGTVRVKGQEYVVQGAGWRDHSWGKRNWGGIRAHRFFAANFGEQLRIACLSYIGDDGHWTKNGVIIKNNEIQFTDQFSITAYMGEDAIGNRGGRLEMIIDGEPCTLSFEPVGKGAVSLIDTFPCVNSMCRVRMADQLGVGMAETSNNPLSGVEKPFVFAASAAVLDNGLFPVT